MLQESASHVPNVIKSSNFDFRNNFEKWSYHLGSGTENSFVLHELYFGQLLESL